MIVNDIRPIMKAALPGVADTWDNLYQFFLNRVRDNLHVCLCFRCDWGQQTVMCGCRMRRCLQA
jgi:hypothetical protein